jgi:ArsR family transcriptional regulator
MRRPQSTSTPHPAGRSRRGSILAASDQEMARFARALAHPARVAILRLLMERGECICGTIVEQLPLAQATVSQHLKVLKEAGLIQGEIDGPRVCYCVNPKAVSRFQELIKGL